jgi:hypothetical protein
MNQTQQSVLKNYIMCPLCKMLILKYHIKPHYYECSEKMKDNQRREEFARVHSPQYRMEEIQKKNEEARKIMKDIRIVEMPSTTITEENKKVVEQLSKFLTPNSELSKKEEKIVNRIYSIEEEEKREKQKREEFEKKKRDEEIKKEEEEKLRFQKYQEERKRKKEEERLQKQQEVQYQQEENNQSLITVENYRPPTLTIYQENVVNHFFQLYDKLFFDYIKDKSVALVGPAESILNTKKGHIIDRFDVVVRLNKSIPLPKDLSKDIGTKTDVLYNSLNTSDFPGENKLSPTLHKKYGIKFVCSSYPFNHSVFKDDILRYVRKYKFELPFKVMDDNRFRRFESALGTRPYTGTCAIMDLLCYPVKYLYITGLDFYYSRYYGQYREISKGQLKHTRNSNIHNAKPQLAYLKHISLLDDRIILDSFLNKIVYEDYDKVLRNMKSIKPQNIFGFQNEQMHQYFHMKLCKVTFTIQPNLLHKLDKSLFIFTNIKNFHASENQYVLYIGQHQQEVKKINENGYKSYVGNFFYTNQKLKEIPSVFLTSKFIIDVKNILLRLNMTNPSLLFILFLAIILYFPEDHLFLESDTNHWITNMEEKKLFKYLCKKKLVNIIY